MSYHAHLQIHKQQIVAQLKAEQAKQSAAYSKHQQIVEQLEAFSKWKHQQMIAQLKAEQAKQNAAYSEYQANHNLTVSSAKQ